MVVRVRIQGFEEQQRCSQAFSPSNLRWLSPKSSPESDFVLVITVLIFLKHDNVHDDSVDTNSIGLWCMRKQITRFSPYISYVTPKIIEFC